MSLALLPSIAPWVGGLMILGALGCIFAYDDLAADYTSPRERMQLTVSLWFMVVVLLISSATTGFTATPERGTAGCGRRSVRPARSPRR